MKVREVMYTSTAAKQFTIRFNKENNTNIETSSEVLDGSVFVCIDFKDTKPELIFKYSYDLGGIQEYLATEGKGWLPLEDYPFPSEEE